MKDIPVLTGRIDALPVLMFSWNCPKCGAFHFKVNRTMHHGEEVVKCMNSKCGEVFERSLFRFNGEDKIAKIISDNAERMFDEAVKGEEKEQEARDAIAS